MTFGQRLKHLRQVAGLSQTALAAQSGVHRPTITVLESGKQTDVMLKAAQRLARVLGVSLEYLAGPEQQDDPQTVTTRGPR